MSQSVTTGADPQLNSANQVPDHLPHGARGLADYPVPDMPWGVILIVLSLILIGVLVWWFLKKRRNRPEKNVHPLVLGLQQLQNITAEAPFSREHQKEFYYQLSLGLRGFLEFKTKMNLTDSTLKEVKLKLSNHSNLSEHLKNEVIVFLKRADLVKFADQESTIEEAQTYHNQIISWLQPMMPNQQEIEIYEKGSQSS